jgi:FkbM family methyltransferase
VIIDIGAHKGFFALYAALNSSVDSTIICFEPAVVNFSILKKNMEVNQKNNVLVVNKGVHAQPGNINLFLFSKANNSIYQDYEQIINKHGVETEPIEVTTLADIIRDFKLDHVDFLKIDCEGSEYDIIFNLDTAILSIIKVISLEFHDLNDSGKCGYALALYLRKKGFSVVVFTYIKSIANLHFGHITAINDKG